MMVGSGEQEERGREGGMGSGRKHKTCVPWPLRDTREQWASEREGESPLGPEFQSSSANLGVVSAPPLEESPG